MPIVPIITPLLPLHPPLPPPQRTKKYPVCAGLRHAPLRHLAPVSASPRPQEFALGDVFPPSKSHGGRTSRRGHPTSSRILHFWRRQPQSSSTWAHPDLRVGTHRLKWRTAVRHSQEGRTDGPRLTTSVHRPFSFPIILLPIFPHEILSPFLYSVHTVHTLVNKERHILTRCVL